MPRNAGGIVSIRAGYLERQELRKQALAAGFDNLSDYVRYRLGLPRGVGATAPLPDMNDLDDMPALLRSYARTIDQGDRMMRLLSVIADHLAVPKEKPERPVRVVDPEEVAAANGGFLR